MLRSWEFFPSTNRLSSDGETVALTGKAAAVLAVLARRAGEVVSREEIIDAVWKGVHVTPDLVREYVHDLRSALGDDAASPRYIETIRGKGFRLIGGIAFGENVVLSELRPRVAVLRPVVHSRNPGWRGLGYSIGKGIVSSLARQTDLVVISHHATFAAISDDPLAMAKQLNADLVLGVTIEFDAITYTVSLELFSGSDWGVLASAQYCGDMDDVSDMQTRIADLVSAELGRFNGHVHAAILRDMRRRPPTDRTAYQEYLLSVECECIHSIDAWRRGLEHASRSVEIDGNFARAWHMRATFLRGLVTFFHDPLLDRDIALADAMASLENSTRLDPNDPQILAWSRFLHVARGDISLARDAVVRAADLGRSQPDTQFVCALDYCQVLGAFDDAVSILDRAFELSPDPLAWHRLVACRVAFFAGDHARSCAAAKAAPTALPSMLFGAMSYAAQRKASMARRMLGLLNERFPRFRPESYAEDTIVDDTARERFFEGLAHLRSVA